MILPAHISECIHRLEQAGFAAYCVGGCVRDHVLGLTPHDYDLCTAATPEQVREVFGRRRARIIGRRFQLVHVRCGKELFEVSTFRRAPQENRHEPQTPGARKIAELEEQIGKEAVPETCPTCGACKQEGAAFCGECGGPL